MTTRQLASRYVQEQIDIMRKHGAAPRLDASQRRDVIASVTKTFDAISGCAEVTKKPATTQKSTKRGR